MKLPMPETGLRLRRSLLLPYQLLDQCPCSLVEMSRIILDMLSVLGVRRVVEL